MGVLLMLSVPFAESPFLRADGSGGGSSFVKDALTARQRLQQLEVSDQQLRGQVTHLQVRLRLQATTVTRQYMCCCAAQVGSV
jgi:hypothetical protein